MSISKLTHPLRLTEASALVCLIAAIVLSLSLYSFHLADPSWNTATSQPRVENLIGRVGAHVSDLLFQLLGLAAWILPAAMASLAIRWMQLQRFEIGFLRLSGFLLLLMAASAGCMLTPGLKAFGGALPAGGVLGVLLSDFLLYYFNPVGAAFVVLTLLLISLYLMSRFSLAALPACARVSRHWLERQQTRWANWRQRRQLQKLARQQLKEEQKRIQAEKRKLREKGRRERQHENQLLEPETAPACPLTGSVSAPQREVELVGPTSPSNLETPATLSQNEATGLLARRTRPTSLAEELAEIPIRTLEDLPSPPESPPPPRADTAAPEAKRPTQFELPPTDLLQPAPLRCGYNEQELKETAARIKAKFEEFHVLGSVVQINPGPVVTTFEYKPEAGIKYSKIVTLNEDLCLGLQAESIFIERIPGKPTVGIEVPNSRREIITLREILESPEFRDSASKLTICLGKDINGRIKVAALETMPHLLIAGSTGSGKSVMLNSLIMSVLYKATPEEVRMILVDPKRVEMGIYEGVPHLLTPVITDAKQATNALRNAVLEMERRLKLLAAHGVRNIDQFNRKMQRLASQKKAEPRSLFEEDAALSCEEDHRPLPYVLIVIDELADLMMLERANVEASVTRLAQMARAVGMHLVLATQRPSVDVITGIIKANFPSRISFRVATRVDSRTVLDVMGAEHLLGKGDMLYLPPGSSRLIRVHGAFVTETEINRVVDHWKQQALPDYDQSYLLPPADEEDAAAASEEDLGVEDPLYRDAVKVVLEMGKASTSILQRRLRLGYGRAARMLDRMQREGIIGPPDGSRPRDVLRRPDWLEDDDGP
ncbi:MAG: DNA translocase FtsK [Bryobacteraceae bacterium]|nr:DNA translocase FtsK [Bryobacteraceae bacterium]MDW8378490.1 DNA translocase FtsK [Bryobacterales bacterium]